MNTETNFCKQRGVSMSESKLTAQGEKLIKQYQITAQERFERADGRKIPAEFAYNKFQRFLMT
jgi:hypothetical protein